MFNSIKNLWNNACEIASVIGLMAIAAFFLLLVLVAPKKFRHQVDKEVV